MQTQVYCSTIVIPFLRVLKSGTDVRIAKSDLKQVRLCAAIVAFQNGVPLIRKGKVQ